MGSLLERDDDTPELRAAVAHDARPGLWATEVRGDVRALSQDETDLLIRTELVALAPPAERDEIIRAVGKPRGVAVDLPGRVGWAHRQRGGIDRDPLVRLLAYRAWGDRDQRWFELRGVRTGELVAETPAFQWVYSVAQAWRGDRIRGRALGDAMPGGQVEVEATYPDGTRWWRRPYHVSDRLRVEPPRIASVAQETQLCIQFGFERLSIERDEVRRCTVLTVGRDVYHSERRIKDDDLAATLSRPAALLEHCRSLDDSLRYFIQRGEPAGWRDGNATAAPALRSEPAVRGSFAEALAALERTDCQPP